MSAPLIYAIILALVCIIYALKNKRGINATLFLLLFLFACAVISYLYVREADGKIRDYSTITLPPYIYLIICHLIALTPISLYDKFNAPLVINSRQGTIIRLISIIFIILSIEPLIENIIKLPSILNNSNAISQMYDSRLSGQHQEYLSSIGRKLNGICSRFELIAPFLLVLAFIQKERIMIQAGILCSILSLWIHDLGIGGRSGMVQDILYIGVAYFILRKYIPHNIDKKVIAIGSSILSIGMAFIVIISLSRFSNMDSNIDSIWLWLGLYAGEGPANFSKLIWNTDRTIGGDITFMLINSLSGISPHLTVAEIWTLKESIGVPGNIFYTYVGSLCFDFTKTGTVAFIVSLSTLIILATYPKKGYITPSQALLICLHARILAIPTFYTYTTFDSQLNLLITITTALVLSLPIQKQITQRHIFPPR